MTSTHQSISQNKLNFSGGGASLVSVQKQLVGLIWVTVDQILWGEHFLVFPPAVCLKHRVSR